MWRSLAAKGQVVAKLGAQGLEGGNRDEVQQSAPHQACRLRVWMVVQDVEEPNEARHTQSGNRDGWSPAVNMTWI